MIKIEKENICFYFISDEYKKNSDYIVNFFFDEYRDLINLLEMYEIQDLILNKEALNSKINILIRDKMYGIAFDGAAFDDNVVFFGFNNIKGGFVHEFAHNLFPIKNRVFSEGLSNYLPYIMYGIDAHVFWDNIRLIDILLAHLNNKYSKYSQGNNNYFELIKDNKKMNDLRLSRIPFINTLSTLFVRYLIEKIGLKKFIEIVLVKESSLDNYKDEYSTFFNSLPQKDIDYSVYDDYFKKELELYDEWDFLYKKHNIQQDELIIDYFWENEIFFNNNEKEEIIGMYKKELSVFHNPLNEKKWI